MVTIIVDKLYNQKLSAIYRSIDLDQGKQINIASSKGKHPESKRGAHCTVRNRGAESHRFRPISLQNNVIGRT